jgi:hypothetical protein
MTPDHTYQVWILVTDNQGANSGWISAATIFKNCMNGLQAQFISQSVPTLMAPSQTTSTTVTMKNTSCDTTWIAGGANPFRLGSQNPQDNVRWGTGRVNLSGNVAPGATYPFTFTFTITAPATPNPYNFQWRMVEDGVAWFGDYSTNAVINVVTPPACTSAGPDSVNESGTTHDVYAYGVTNATSVVFPTWSDLNGQDDIIWYPGVNQGGGTWKATIDFANHPGYGTYSTHVYMANASYTNIFCDWANFTRIPTLSVSLAASPTSGPAPLSSILQATVGGTAAGTMNYSFWWNCIDTGTSVAGVSSICGNLTDPGAGSCIETVGVGYKCNAISTSPQNTVSHIYTPAASYTGKVIVERSAALPAEARTTITASAFCGNGVWPEGSEQCDDGINNGTCPTALCSTSCIWNTCNDCGNGVLEPGESCDDGDLAHGDSDGKSNGTCSDTPPSDCSTWCTWNTCTHLGCDPLLMCKPLAGGGADECAADNDCGHNVCQGISPGTVTCTRLTGPGLNGCTYDLECITYYDTCIGYACTRIPGDPAASTCSPQGSPPGSLPACPLPPGTCTMSINPNRIVIPPQRATGPSLEWNCQNVQANTCVMNQGIGPVQEASSMNVSPSVSTTYTVTCTGLDGTPAAATADLKVYNFSGGVLKEIRF